MHHAFRLALTVCGTAVLAAWFAPTAAAMMPLPDPQGVSTVVSSSSVALAVWQAIAIALVAVAIGCIGTLLAQRATRGERSPLTAA